MREPSKAGTVIGRFVRQVLAFGAVGAVGVLVTFTVFNLLMLTVFHPADVHQGPLFATVVSTAAAIATNWFGNRYWAFAGTGHRRGLRQGGEFVLVSVAAMGIPLACVWVSHYVLGLTSLAADNLAANVVGLALGAVFRFALYRWWVFSPQRAAEAPRTRPRAAAPHADGGQVGTGTVTGGTVGSPAAE